MQALTIGPVHTLALDEIYAMPARAVLVAVDAAVNPVIQLANDINFTIPYVPAFGAPYQSSHAFIRATVDSVPTLVRLGAL